LYSPAFFFVVPKTTTTPFYIRVFDPDIGGEIDEARGEFNTKTKFSVYGGSGCFSHKDARKTSPSGNFKSGNLLGSKIFGINPKYDNKWYAFGPFNPSEGEFIKKFEGYLFKVIAEGISGNDGNLYKYFFSSNQSKNVALEGGNCFTYEYSIRLSDKPNHKSHIYPFIDDKVVSLKVHIFDWDNEGKIRVVSNSKNGRACKISGEGNWVVNNMNIVEEEKNTTFDVQFIKPAVNPLKNNNGVIYITNQYNESLPFYTSPIGGAPKYKYKINVKKVK